jgi:hypothetical protein
MGSSAVATRKRNLLLPTTFMIYLILLLLLSACYDPHPGMRNPTPEELMDYNNCCGYSRFQD